MSMRFPYRLAPKNQPVVSLDGRFARPRPLIDIAVLGPSGSVVRPALLDTGSDDTVFSERTAAMIGVDLANAPTGPGIGFGSAVLSVRYSRVTLRIAAQSERREWTAWVGFTASPMPYPVLGFAGFLQFFDAHFRGGLEEVELAANALYPGK